MINYDIPWNPNRLEQRMGRIHRYGQQKEVFVFNLVAVDTREGKVLHKLFEKLDEIRAAMGSDKVFDVLSEVLYNQNLSQLMIEAAANSRNIDDILQEIDINVDENYIAQVKENLGESLATRYIDYTRIKEMEQKAREHRLIPEYTESFFKKAFAKAGGKFRERKDAFLAIDSVPYGIRKIAEEDGFKKSFGELLKKYPEATFDKEIHRVLKPNGFATIVYAHKSTEGWETLINSLLDSGLIVTGAWPLNTEMGSRLRASESAALASSIYIIARKMERQSTGFYNRVKEELNQYLATELERLWQEGISGSDFFIAAIGSAIEVFGKYEKVMDYEGNIVRADRLLHDVRRIVTDFAVRQILHNGFAGEISDLTRFYVLFRWNYGAARVPFDEARKLAQSCSIDLANEWNRAGFIKKEKEFIRVLGPQDRRGDRRVAPELIDVMHHVLLLWETSKRDEMVALLQETGYGQSEAFYRVGQAISECLPNDNKEKKLLDGFLSGRERLQAEVKKVVKQAGLFD